MMTRHVETVVLMSRTAAKLKSCVKLDLVVDDYYKIKAAEMK